MSRRRAAVGARRRGGRPTGGQQGQALLVVVAVVAVLTLVPIGAQVLATGQTAISGQSVDRQIALEAARAGLSDYVDHLQAVPDYLGYCSPVFCPGGTVDTANPAFVTDLGLTSTTWSTVDTAAGEGAFQYVVDTAGVDPSSPSPQRVTVDVTGRGGGPAGRVEQTLQAVLRATPQGQTVWFPGTPTEPCSSDPSQYQLSFAVPIGATYAHVTAYGAQGGANGGWAGTGGGSEGAEEQAWVPVTGGTTWTAGPGYAGAGAGFALLGILAGGGPGGCNDINLSGGSGGNGGLLQLIDSYGGGGGGGTFVCLGSQGQCDDDASPALCTSMAAAAAPCLIAVAGGGGGQGGYGGPEGTYSSGSDGVGGNSSTVGADGQWAAAVLSAGCGTGGGGGGGFATASSGGGSGGADSGLSLLGLACLAGEGYGGNAGASAVTSTYLSSGGCSAPTTAGASAPAGAPNGEVVVTFYSGTVCPASPLPMVSVSALLTRSVAPNTT